MTLHAKPVARWLGLLVAWPLVLTIVSLRRVKQCPAWADRLATELGWGSVCIPSHNDRGQTSKAPVRGLRPLSSGS